MNWSMVLLRGARLPALGVFVALVIMWAAGNMQATPLGAEVFEPFRWAGLAAMSFAALSYSHFMYRLIRWQRNEGDQGCDRCGGPTGFLQTGRVIRGNQLSDFRRCYNCGRASPQE
ncbi:hypothetical protein [Luteimonas sp. 3794]|uniref:hypothetical protein n=1 Tax=Luteimonas sp. 3794 TaxID=2817730 RepID=UPI0028580A30|nr:hypothetical protein [Luteimonas sp. 3794]MDR6992459.1 hypothetical protein [Luteimonas sp. 3794]